MKTLTNRVIGLVLALAMIAAFVLVPMPMDIKAQAATVTSTNLVDNIQDGVTLQCWNWSIANIKANLGLIANMGYSAIQVSPMQEMKEGTVNKPVNNWWAVYQPISFYINKSQSHCVGTKDELIDLCTEAHKYGIKVIMDVVFNHTANNGANQLCPMVDPDFLNDPACWHDYSQNSSSYNDRYDVTQRCMAGLPDINTGNQKVQDKALALMKEYVDCGVDGFRFDAAKQIETPDDHSSYASDFWPTVVNGTTSYAQSTRGFTPYYYGELLQDTDNYGSLPISAYTKYMSATESVWSNDIRYKMEEHNASALRKAYFKDAPADKLVLWAESHDTIGDLSSLYSSDYVRNKAWALAASRAYTMALYFPRSNDMTNIDPNAKDRIYQEMGELAKLGWSSEFTKQVNYFHNHFAGQSEYLTQDTGSNLYYNERGNSGVIITNFNDGGRDINLPVYAMASGTYYDQLTGNKFTVSGGRIYGTMGDTGVAVVYNPSTKSCSHSSHGADGYCYSCYAYVGHKSGSTCSTCGTASTRTIYFINSKNWTTPYIYGWHDVAGEATASWPGTKMTKVEGSIWSAEIPTTATNIIFNDNAGNQTANLVPSASDDTYDIEFGYWSTRGEVVVADNYYLFYTTNSGAYNGYDYRFVDGKLTMSFAETSYVWIIDSNGVQYMCDGWPGEVTSATMKTLNSMSGTPDKLPVPHSKELTFTMSFNTDGSLNLSYTVGGAASGGAGGGSTGGGTTTTTKTIYFTNTSNWSSVNVYAWNGNGDCTGSWPGSAMTSVGNNVYSYNVPSDAVNIIFNNGNGSQTSDLTIPTDGKNHYTGSAWTTYTSGGSTGGDSGSTGGDVTGGNVPDNTYYLFWGNSSGSLSHNEWDTPFVGGKTTVTFDETMYVWVITNAGGIQYMTDGWQGNVNSVKLYPQPQLTEPNKLVVPAGTQTLTLSDNGDGSLTLAYGAGNSGNTGGSTGGSTGGTTTDTKTIYFDCGSAWSKANVYAWDDSTGEYTGGWPGSSMTALGNGVYSYEVPTAATKIIFNDGTSQTSDMVIPTDGKNLYTLTSDAWSTYTTGGGNQGGSTTTAQYVQVTDLNEILSGGEFMIAVKNGNTYRALSQSISGMTIAATGITVNGNVASGAPVFTVKPADGGVIFNVNGTDVSFGGSPAVLVIAKGSTGFTVTAKAISSYGILYNIPNDQFMITTVSNAGSVNYISEALFFKYTEVTTGCDHSYTSKVTTAATCDKAGVKTYTCSKCGDSYTESIAALGHSYTSKVTTAATCTTAGVKTFTCGTCGNSYTESIAATGHSFVGGTCTVCGATDGTDTPDPGATYYLVGWINGADYGCESDYENMGQYKFVNGKLSVKFDSDSYVFVKTEGNGKWLLAEAFCELTSCTFVEGGTEKMYIPGGVQLTLTLVENADGSVTISYTQGGTTSCTHSYTSKVTTAATCTTAGVKTYTCSKCGSSYTESIPMISHNFVSGNCTYCGAFDPSTALSETYYLVGWINGADYGCESDYENNGIYKFVNGQLSVKFDQDSYIFVKTENNGKWLLADAYCEAASCTFKVGGTEKMFVPGGVQLIFSIVENADGSVTVTYTEGSTSACTHSYTAEVTTAATCTDTGIRTYTCSKCGDSYTQVIPATGHSFFDNKCTVCGAADPNANGNTYYLVGYINGADYGCEDDFKNMGDYKFVDGKLTVKFDQDSYVFVKTEGNTQWLLSTYYCEASTCVFVDGGNEKMFVPGGVELNFTLTENANGGVTLTYTNGSTPASTVPTLTLKSPTLEFKDMITVNAFYTAENIEDVVEMGMITYSSQPTYWSIRTADYVIPGYSYVESTGRYYSASQGIHAKYLADTVYLAVYAKLADGSYAYSKLAPYSPVTYANSQLKNSTNASLKQLVVAMLNYGAEAQLFFGHNTGNLANATLTAEQLALPSAYNSSMVSAVPAASATKQGSFANNSGFSKRYPAISFEGAFCINYFFTPNYEPANGITLYYWNAEDYAAASVLTTSNATGSLKMNGTGTNEYRGDITGIAAKEISEAVYVAAAYKDASGTVWTSGVLGYSIGAYCSSQASKAADISELAKATAVYGYHAKQYFG